MAEKNNNISKFSNSLTDFLVDAMTDRHSDARHIAQRLNNLKVFMDPIKIREPHFFVSIGISEACYSIETGKKLDGSLGPEDSYVTRWAGRSNINNELKNHWKNILDAVELDAEEDATKKAIDAIKMRPEEKDESLAVDMTGTGISRVRPSSRGKRRYYYNGEILHLTPAEFAALEAGEIQREDIKGDGSI